MWPNVPLQGACELVSEKVLTLCLDCGKLILLRVLAIPFTTAASLAAPAPLCTRATNINAPTYIYTATTTSIIMTITDPSD